MSRNSTVFFSLLVFLAAILACVSPVSTEQPAKPDNVETIVAVTVQALTAPAAGITPPAQPPASSLLPRTLYFLNNDAAGLAQVYRLEKDGVTLKQVTAEPVKVTEYDVSVMDGSVIYVANNQLLLINTDGSNRRVLVDGGVTDENNPFLTNIRSPVWSPNGQTIAYGHKGLNFYSVATNQANRVLEDNIDDVGNGFLVPREMFWPEKYTADGSKLVITLGYYEGASAAIYYPNGSALVRVNGGDGALICCGDTEWTTDGSAFYAANPSLGMFSPGLWRVDSASGVVTTLLNGDAGNGTFNFADEPFLAPDGQLYYFFANQPAGQEFVSRVPVQLVRSAPDGVTGRVVLRQEPFNLMNEALWSPDGSFVIVANASIPDIYQGGQIEMVYVDGRPNVVLAPFAVDMLWGP
ncbi:MAG: hypothetical protein MUO77_00820 [Anaerolineales bacterium]|nr:hypothetical protein [Anaerolineales bacterium]